jgi:hypothetical protein
MPPNIAPARIAFADGLADNIALSTRRFQINERFTVSCHDCTIIEQS